MPPIKIGSRQRCQSQSAELRVLWQFGLLLLFPCDITGMQGKFMLSKSIFPNLEAVHQPNESKNSPSPILSPFSWYTHLHRDKGQVHIRIRLMPLENGQTMSGPHPPSLLYKHTATRLTNKMSHRPLLPNQKVPRVEIPSRLFLPRFILFPSASRRSLGLLPRYVNVSCIAQTSHGTDPQFSTQAQSRAQYLNQVKCSIGENTCYNSLLNLKQSVKDYRTMP